MPKISNETLIEKANAVHSNKYTYGAFVRNPKRSGQLFAVTCPQHGEFTQVVTAHLAGKGCKRCAVEALALKTRHTLESVIEKTAKFGWSYVYTRLNYFNDGHVHPEIVYTCPEHGEVTQNLYNHLSGKGCGGCKTTRLRHTLASATAAGRAVHGEKYEYQSLDYRAAASGRKFDAWVKLSCKLHGEFEQLLNTHITGSGCSACGDLVLVESRKKPDEDIQALAAGRVDYPLVRIVRPEEGAYRTVSNCSTHGEFEQSGYNRLVLGQSCPKCSKLVSKAALEISKWLEQQEQVVQLEFKLGDSKFAADVAVPEQRLLVEHHGIYWHSDEYRGRSYHIDKHNLATSLGYRTIHIFDDEWRDKRSIVERALLNSVGKSVDPKVSARRCQVVSVSASEARAFLDRTHIQGYVAATAYFGLSFEGQLVAVGGFSMKERGRSGRKSSEQVELVRYSTCASVRGGLSRILTAAQRQLGFKVCTTFSDIRFFEGGAYKATGFSEIERLRPDYFYCRAGKRVHKSALQKTRVQKAAEQGKALFDPKLTEAELATLNGYSRVWDCGKIVWQRRWE